MSSRPAGGALAPTHRAPASEAADNPIGSSAASGPPPAVRLVGVRKQYGAVTAVDDVSVDVPDGELVTLLGPSGCGKTTLLRIVAGFERPTAGRVEIGGRDVTSSPPERRPVNLIFQRWALFPNRTVLQNVTFGLEAERVPRREARDRALAALATCQIDHLAGRHVHELSGGQAQRVAVARAIVKRPRVLLLDEPLSALDLKLRRHLQLELRRLQQTLGMTFLYVTHDQDEALALSDSIVVMREGRVEQHSSPRELYDRPRTLFTATFVGEANVLACTVQRVIGSHARVAVGGSIAEAVARTTAREGDQATLCVRPEALHMTPGHGDGIHATVVDVIFAGATVRYALDLVDAPGAQVAVSAPVTPDETLVRLGSDVSITWSPDAAYLFSS